MATYVVVDGRHADDDFGKILHRYRYCLSLGRFGELQRNRGIRWEGSKAYGCNTYQPSQQYYVPEVSGFNIISE